MASDPLGSSCRSLRGSGRKDRYAACIKGQRLLGQHASAMLQVNTAPWDSWTRCHTSKCARRGSGILEGASMARNPPSVSERILETEPVRALSRMVEEATRSTREGAKRFVEPAEGTLERAKTRRHHIVFGRRGSGKSSLLTKAAAELTIDRRPIVFVDLEEFKGHTYPDVLISVLIRALGEFETWLKTAAVNPGTKKTFWDKLFGAVPRRPALKKTLVAELNNTLGELLTELKPFCISPTRPTIWRSAKFHPTRIPTFPVALLRPRWARTPASRLW